MGKTKTLMEADGHSVYGSDDHWSVKCPNCDIEYEYSGFYDSGEVTHCRCGCDFVTTRLWIDEDHYVN